MITGVVQCTDDAAYRQHFRCIVPQSVKQSSAPEDGRNYRSKHVELIDITNNVLLLHLVGCFYYCTRFNCTATLPLLHTFLTAVETSKCGTTHFFFLLISVLVQCCQACCTLCFLVIFKLVTAKILIKRWRRNIFTRRLVRVVRGLFKVLCLQNYTSCKLIYL